ncbi:MAG: cytochrome c-type biogenesis protein [Pseudorhodoplanes sp.]
MRRYFALVIGGWLLISGPAFAVQPDEILQDPALEARARALSRELRCMVCQNQSIDDSDAPLARDLRILVRERLSAGDSDRAVLDYLTARYGDFVLLKPRFAWHTALLWLLPALLLAAGIAVVALAARRAARRRSEQAGLSAAERERVERLLDTVP